MGSDKKESLRVVDLTDPDTQFVRMRIEDDSVVLPLIVVAEAVQLMLSSGNVPRGLATGTWGTGKSYSVRDPAKAKEHPTIQRHESKYAGKITERRQQRQERVAELERDLRREWQQIEEMHPTPRSRHNDLMMFQSLEVYLRRQLMVLEAGEWVRVSSMVNKIESAHDMAIPNHLYEERLDDVLSKYVENPEWGPRVHAAVMEFAQKFRLGKTLSTQVGEPPVRGPKTPRPRVGRSLASLSQFVMHCMAESENWDVKQHRLIDALRDFNGIIKHPITTTLFWDLQYLKDEFKPSRALANEIDIFLDAYPELEKSTGGKHSRPKQSA